MRLLSKNTKLTKSITGATSDWSIVGLALPPHNLSGRQLCPQAGACADVCVLWYAGRTVTKTYRRAAHRRAKMLFNQPDSFKAQLSMEVQSHWESCTKQGIRAACRLNVASDLDWLQLLGADWFQRFDGVTFYDYTKMPRRAEHYAGGKYPTNYHLTYSYSERSQPERVRALLNTGCNVAVVCDADYLPQQGILGELPATFEVDVQHFPVVDGDSHDLRIPELDGRGSIIMLRGKRWPR